MFLSDTKIDFVHFLSVGISALVSHIIWVLDHTQVALVCAQSIVRTPTTFQVSKVTCCLSVLHYFAYLPLPAHWANCITRPRRRVRKNTTPLILDRDTPIYGADYSSYGGSDSWTPEKCGYIYIYLAGIGSPTKKNLKKQLCEAQAS